MAKKRVKKRNKKLLYLGIGVCLIIAILLLCMALNDNDSEEISFGTIGNVDVPTIEEVEDKPNQSRKELTVHTIDVGQGLSCLIDFGNTEILYDGGSYEYGKTVSDYIKPYVSDNTIEYVIISHPHEDHAGGLAQIYEDYNVLNTISGTETPNSKVDSVIKCFESAKKEENSTFRTDDDLTFELGNGATLSIVETFDEGENDNINNLSVIAYITYEENKIIITGDAEREAEKLLKGNFSNLDLVIAGHHGSNTANTLLESWQPRYFVISAGANNQYGHPHKEVLKRATGLSDTYSTINNGNIVFSCDGKNCGVVSQKGEKLQSKDIAA